MNTRDKASIAPAWTLAGAAAVLATTIGVCAENTQAIQAPPSATATATKQAQDEKAFATLGEQTTDKICVICHPWENIISTRRTVREWNDMVINMAQRGAPGTEQQFTIVKKFLSRYYGVVNVNAAAADEIAAVLGLSAKDAAAIVEYRRAHGKFADAAALARVEGIDKAKISEQPEALRFD
jgi:competence ComEA-like helix-hairpin-helix protein